MYRISEIRLKLDGTYEELKKQAALRLKVNVDDIISLKLYKKSVDARKKDNVHFICTVDVECNKKIIK